MNHAHIAWLEDDGSSLEGFALPAHELAEMQRFKHLSRQRSFFLSRLLLRQTLSVLLPGHAPQFSRTESGRLVLASHGDWHISLSHAQAGIAVIVAQRPCGIDIEPPRPVAMEKITARYFSAGENATMLATPTAHRPALFFRLWTLKEAGAKALGEGLADNMARLAFDVSGEQPRTCTGTPALQLWQEQVGTHLMAAAVTGTHAVQWQVRRFHIAELGKS